MPKRKTQKKSQTATAIRHEADGAVDYRSNVDASLLHVLTPHAKEDVEALERMRAQGASDAALQDWVVFMFGTAGQVATDGYEYSFDPVGDHGPRFWLGFNTDVAPILEGQTLTDAVRRVLSIPYLFSIPQHANHEKLSLTRIKAAKSTASERHVAYLEAKSECQAAKKRWEAAVNDLQLVISEETETNLFNQPDSEGSGSDDDDDDQE